jgi:hypothetical protein
MEKMKNITGKKKEHDDEKQQKQEEHQNEHTINGLFEERGLRESLRLVLLK